MLRVMITMSIPKKQHKFEGKEGKHSYYDHWPDGLYHWEPKFFEADFVALVKINGQAFWLKHDKFPFMSPVDPSFVLGTFTRVADYDS